MFCAQRPMSRPGGRRSRRRASRRGRCRLRRRRSASRSRRSGALDDEEPPRLPVACAAGEPAGVEDASRRPRPGSAGRRSPGSPACSRSRGTCPPVESLRRPHERLVLDPVRLERLWPACLGDPGGVLLPAPLEPGGRRVALEGEDVRRDPVEEPAVVRDHHRAAGEVEERVLERAQRVDVEVVRRLVEQQQVAARAQELREVDAVALAAGEVADLLLLIGAAEVEPGDVLAGVDLARPELDQVVAAGDLLPDGGVRVEVAAGLVDVGELDRLARPSARRSRAAPRRRSCGTASSCRRRSARSPRRSHPAAARTRGSRPAAGRRSPC